MKIQVAIVTVSDRASRGNYTDRSGPALIDAVSGFGWDIAAQRTVPDDQAYIQSAIRQAINQKCMLVLTTGGTGITDRDVTPEAVRQLQGLELPGFGELMRQKSLEQTPNAILSRNLAVIVDATLVVCLPGKPSAAVDCLSYVAEAIPHCLELLANHGDDTHSALKNHTPM